jgi:SAM-dependent methyltransferase
MAAVTTSGEQAGAGGPAARRWAEQLAAWAIPAQILEQAPQSPWIHPVELFRAGGAEPDSPSHRLARAAVPDGGAVLDVGSGGGRAAFALVPPAGEVTGVDHQQSMLDAFAAEAERRGVRHAEVLGGWPEAADRAPVADVVTCHHVVYNVADLVPFVRALDGHARRRVVLELPRRHPLAGMAPLWRRFWDLERPDGPGAQDAAAVLREAGITPQLETWEDNPGTRPMAALPWEDQVRFMRIRLCLPAERDPEVSQALAEQGPPPPRRLATLWWDVARP